MGAVRSASATTHPTSTAATQEYNDEILGQLTQVLSNRMLNEVKAGKTAFGIAQTSLANWSNHWQRANGITNGAPRIMFTGFSFNLNQNIPRTLDQDIYSVRDDFTYSFSARASRPADRRRVTAP